MESEIAPATAIAAVAATTLDDVAIGLARMRLDAGAVSFSELASRIQRRRESLGLDPIAARIPRSTVYDAFLTGRRRIDPDLVVEIVLALGGDETTANEWRVAAIQAMRTEPQPPAHAVLVPKSAAARYGTVLTESPALLLTVFIACVFVNIFAHVPVDPLGWPIYLDMIGTAIAAIALGPWAGAAVGLTSNLLSSTVIMHWPGMWFALVNVAGGLLWGFGYHHWRLRTPLKFIGLCAIVAFGCTLVAVPVLVLVFGGSSGSSQDTLLSLAGLVGEQVWATVLSSNMLTSLADKLISGLVALTVCTLFALGWRRRSRRND